MTRRNVTRAVRRGATFLDRRVARIGLRFERPALLTFLFHSVFESEAEVHSGPIHPQEAITRADFARFVEHLLGAGYRFVNLAEVERGLAEPGRYACVTFDDGYANNLRIVDTLHEYRIPAAIFVSTSHVEQGRRFWWDAVYFERTRRGASLESIDEEIEFLKSLEPTAIDAHVRQAFGPGVFEPLDELDRPLRPDELRALARDEWITIGNHTMDHAILTVLSEDEARRQVAGAQRYLEEQLGLPIRAISYPNGNFDEGIVRAARDAGLSCGITTIRRKERVPVSGSRLFEIGRFQLERGVDIDQQVAVLRSGIQLTNTARRIRDRGLVRR